MINNNNYTVNRSDGTQLVLHGPHTRDAAPSEATLLHVEIANALWAIHKAIVDTEVGANLTAIERTLDRLASVAERAEAM